MKWVTIKRTHVNTNNVDSFRWENGLLVVFYTGTEAPARWADPEQKLYRRLCRQLGVLPYEEGEA